MMRFLTGFAAGVVFVLACDGDGHRSTVDAAVADTPGVDGTTIPAVADKLHVRTAETDSDQLETGQVPGTAMLTTGPFVLTDVQVEQDPRISNSAEVYVSTGATCGALADAAWFVEVRDTAPVHGARYFVKAGTVLCIQVGVHVLWAGFHPYAAP